MSRGAENFNRYGARGISVCDRWNNYENFITDMGKRPSPKHSIDRIDNERGYGPDNCMWATASQQSRNMRSNRFVELDGKKMILTDAAAILGVSYMTLLGRLRKNPRGVGRVRFWRKG